MSTTRPERGAEGSYIFFALTCGLTWVLATPLAIAWSQRAQPAPWAVAMAGLSALGPTLAALMIAWRRRELREVFGHWRTHPIWIVLALLVLPALHLMATLTEVALGGHPAHWFYPPTAPEQIAALVMFSVFEEFGWRGFAYPRMARRFGPVLGSVLLGVVWALWHLPMMFSPQTGQYRWDLLLTHLIDMPLFSIAFAWFFEKGGRSMAVAIALHAGAHLDNVDNAPAGELRLRILRLLFSVLFAVIAARLLITRGRADAGSQSARSTPSPRR